MQNDAGAVNNTASLLTAIAILEFIAALIVGIVLGKDSWEFSWGTALICWGVGFISGMLTIGLAEVIKLLQMIADKQ